MHPHHRSPRRRLVLPIAAGLLSLLLLAPAGASAATAKPLYGIQGVPALPDASQAQVDAALDNSRKLHSTVVRVEVLWDHLEPTATGVRDDAYLAAIDRVVAGATARGMKTLLMVDSTPCWASSAPDAIRQGCVGPAGNGGDSRKYPPANPADFVSVSTFLAARYGTQLTAFEVWNEPDQANQNYWAGPDKVARYVALAKAVYGPLKQTNPNLTVLVGSFVGTNGKWLDSMYKAGIKGAYDALSVHFYDLTLYGLRNTRAIQRANGDKKPIWLAEFGYTSCATKKGPSRLLDHVCITRAAQRQDLVDTLRAVAKHASFVKAAVIFTLTDQSTAYQFGVLDGLGRRKPAFAGVANAFLGQGSITKPKLKLSTSKGRLVASGSASRVEVLTITLRQNGRKVYIVNLRTARNGKFRIVLPRSVGTRGKVTLSAGWTGTVSRTH